MADAGAHVARVGVLCAAGLTVVLVCGRSGITKCCSTAGCSSWSPQPTSKHAQEQVHQRCRCHQLGP